LPFNAGCWGGCFVCTLFAGVKARIDGGKKKKKKKVGGWNRDNEASSR
jgi:hypothetical protein